MLLSACARRQEVVESPVEVRVEENAPPPPPADAPATLEPEKVTAEIRASMKAVSPTEHTMTRRAFALLAEQHLVRAVRLAPEQTNGKVTGLRLYGIRRDSIPADLGLENGDRIVSINGTPIESPEQLLESYGQLRKATSIEVVLQRAGQPVRLILRLVE
jgi:general secretion pathway protein C